MKNRALIIVFAFLFFSANNHLYAQEDSITDTTELIKTVHGSKFEYKEKTYKGIQIRKVVKNDNEARLILKKSFNKYLVGCAVLWTGAYFTGTYLGDLIFTENSNIMDGLIGFVAISCGTLLYISYTKGLKQSVKVFNKNISSNNAEGSILRFNIGLNSVSFSYNF